MDDQLTWGLCANILAPSGGSPAPPPLHHVGGQWSLRRTAESWREGRGGCGEDVTVGRREVEVWGKVGVVVLGARTSLMHICRLYRINLAAQTGDK